jgi:hypothetical protein
LSLEDCLARLRYVKYGDEVLSSDHNTKFECLRRLRDRIAGLADKLGVRSVVDPVLGRLDAILALLKYRVALDIIDPEDHNLLVDGLKAARDALAELEAVVVAPPPPPPPPAPPPPRVGLWYRMSTVRVEDSTGLGVFDDESRLSFTLPEDSYVLVIYNASNRHGSPEAKLGKYCVIHVDDEYQLNSWHGQSTDADNVANSVTCTWAGRLPAGAHTVAVEISGNWGAYPVGVNVRQVIVLAVPVSSGPLAYGTSAYQNLCIIYSHWTSDPFARLFLNLAGEANVLLIYNISKEYDYPVRADRPTGYLYLDGRLVPESVYTQRIYDFKYAFGVTSVAFHRLGAGIHSILGGIEDTCISTSTIAYIVAPKPWVSAGRMSSTLITGSQDTMGSPPPWDDPDSIITIDLAEDSLCLAVYNAQFTSWAIEGEFTMINVDGVDMPESFAAQSSGRSYGNNQILSLWAGRLPAGSHTIKGRWGSNNPAGKADLMNRVIAVICIPESLLI